MYDLAGGFLLIITVYTWLIAHYDRVIMFRPVRLSEIILQHCYFVGIRTSQPAKTPASCSNQAAQLDWGLLRETTTSTTSTKTPRKRRKAELKTRIAEHLSERGRPPGAAMLSDHKTTSWREYRRHPRYISTESEKCPVERPLPGQNTHFEQLIR